ncbi:MAG: hypothetical protein CVV47_01240 [Spirochaetae bacterium HGW-Spirochaetae-3]|jgi:tetratricopeptide (TPR) repeat protein|nr:MAG: hypothetical protein CVV47_01240 [Spirochaetae bacterium HGW-Spirochaetae-3]
MERTRIRELTRRGGVAAAVAISLSLFGACRGAEPSFGALLAKIDADPAAATRSAYLNAAALASGTEERLRLLKRASALDPVIYADSAREIMAAGPVSEPVAMAVLDAYLGAGCFEEALALFDGPLDPADKAAALAETLVLATRTGYSPPRQSVDRLVLCSDATMDGRFMESAAVDSMLEGDRPRARALLDDATKFSVRNGRRIPYRLLWDAVAVEALCDRVPDPSDPLEISVGADAEYLRGNIASACAAYADLIGRFPSWSWKPYAALARSGVPVADESPSEWPHALKADSYAALSNPTRITARLFSDMAERFPDSTGAALERARWLASIGQRERAASEAATVSGEAAAIAGVRYGPLARAVPDALRLAAEYPASPRAIDEALAALAKSGAWERFSEIAARSAASGIETERSWFWRIVAYSLSGDAIAAAKAIRDYGIESAGYPGAYDLGILELAASRPAKSAAAFVLAAGLAASPEERADAYVMAGDALRATDSREDARSAYEAALSAFPASRVARSRLERLTIDD